MRPPTSYTEPLKLQGIKDYGYTDTNPRDYEMDHLIPLELGGSSVPANLWPELGSIPNKKDAVENLLKKRVCAGTISLATAQAEILDWTSVS